MAVRLLYSRIFSRKISPNILRSLSSLSICADGSLKSPYPDIEIKKLSFPDASFSALEKFGPKVALIDVESQREVTYSNLLDQTVKVISSLKKLGLEKDDIVTICSTNNLEYFTIFLAIVSIGAIPSTVNPAYQQEDLQRTCEVTNSKFLIVSSQLANIAKNVKSEHLKAVMTLDQPVDGCLSFQQLLDDDGSAFSDNWNFKVEEDTLVLPFSSGTTGLPKGVMLTHYNVYSNIRQTFNEHTKIDFFNKKILGVLPFFHIYGQVVILLGTIFQGGTILVHSKFEPQQFLKSLNDYRPEILPLVPPLVLFMAHHAKNACPEFSAYCEMVLCGAAPLSKGLSNKFCSELNFNRLLGAYGLTETSPVTHVNPYDAPRADTVGFTLPNGYTKLVDPETGKTVSEPNVEGEICIKGPHVMKGYYKNQKATDEMIKGEWLHSGDIGQFHTDGHFSVTDRIKELIKYKGYQVAPAELEGILLTNEFVADAAVIGKPDEEAGELPTAFVLLKQGSETTEEDLLQYVAERVARQKKLRGGIKFVKEIPKAPSDINCIGYSLNGENETYNCPDITTSDRGNLFKCFVENENEKTPKLSWYKRGDLIKKITANKSCILDEDYTLTTNYSCIVEWANGKTQRFDIKGIDINIPIGWWTKHIKPPMNVLQKLCIRSDQKNSVTLRGDVESALKGDPAEDFSWILAEAPGKTRLLTYNDIIFSNQSSKYAIDKFYNLVIKDVEPYDATKYIFDFRPVSQSLSAFFGVVESDLLCNGLRRNSVYNSFRCPNLSVPDNKDAIISCTLKYTFLYKPVFSWKKNGENLNTVEHLHEGEGLLTSCILAENLKDEDEYECSVEWGPPTETPQSSPFCQPTQFYCVEAPNSPGYKDVCKIKGSQVTTNERQHSTIFSKLENVLAKPGDNIVLKCETGSNNSPNKWYFYGNGTSVQISSSSDILNEYKDKYDIEGNFNLKIKYMTPSESGRYECVWNVDDCTPRGLHVYLGLADQSLSDSTLVKTQSSTVVIEFMKESYDDKVTTELKGFLSCQLKYKYLWQPMIKWYEDDVLIDIDSVTAKTDDSNEGYRSCILVNYNISKTYRCDIGWEEPPLNLICNSTFNPDDSCVDANNSPNYAQAIILNISNTNNISIVTEDDIDKLLESCKVVPQNWTYPPIIIEQIEKNDNKALIIGLTVAAGLIVIILIILIVIACCREKDNRKIATAESNKIDKISDGPEKLFIIQRPASNNIYNSHRNCTSTENIIKFEDVEIGMHVS
ncbi:DgyrCDS6706 [Dimorphilus gyrociliatus]|uniref:DgyrCDS6706 n=1 Tax=Dimorphilus gyrociliatus TaxID=2664684 RepID=A0A7I8VTN5_9ANNE|nr:DgyrCDS6706 [Dimorphilus gyrociliatus]